MKGQRSPQDTLATAAGLALCAFALVIAFYGLVLGGSSDRDCIDNYACPPAVVNALIILAFLMGALAAIGLGVAGGARILREPLRRPGWLLAGGGAAVAVAVILAELYYAGAKGAFS